jgi:hypothetical protein
MQRDSRDVSGQDRRVVFNQSSAPIARKMGFSDLLQIADLSVEVQGNGLATTRTYLKTNRDTAKQAFKGYLEAIHLSMPTKRRRSDLWQIYAHPRPGSVRDLIQNYVKTIPKRPNFTLKGIQFMLDMLAPQMPQAKSETGAVH